MTWVKYEFDRYRDGRLMAEGASAHGYTQAEALSKVIGMFAAEHGRTMFKLSRVSPPECSEPIAKNQSVSDAELLAMASAFDLIPFDPNGRSGTIRGMTIERRCTNPEAWSIVNDGGNTLLRDGWWVIEPSPSTRDDKYLTQARWPSAREAVAFAREHMAKHPTGYLEEQCKLHDRP